MPFRSALARALGIALAAILCHHLRADGIPDLS
jgi:hypothetical protein